MDGVQDVPLVREALSRNRKRQRRTAIGILLLGLISGWAANDFLQDYAKTLPLTSSDAGGGASADVQLLPQTVGPWNKYAAPPTGSPFDTNSTPPAGGNDLLSDEEFFGESLDEDVAIDLPPIPELKPLPHLMANSGIIPESAPIAMICQETVRPANGATLEGESHGPHELVIKNGTSEDAIVKLRNSDPANELMFYVHKKATTRFFVYDGKFSILFMQGRGYSASCKKFIEDRGKWKYPDIQKFLTKIEGVYIMYTVIELTLHEVPHGNIQKVPITDAEWQG